MRAMRTVRAMRAVGAMAREHGIVVGIPKSQDQLSNRALLFPIDNGHWDGSRMIHIRQEALRNRDRTYPGDSGPQEEGLGCREKSTRPGEEVGELLGKPRKIVLRYILPSREIRSRLTKSQVLF